ncbi:hypothetical protein HDZ31DRAFT_70339 [Schizophyllum fasciatum]
MYPQRATGYRHRPASLMRAAGSMSFMGPSPTRNRVFFVGILSLPGFPQFHACTAEFLTDQFGRVVVYFHPNYVLVDVNTGVVRQSIYHHIMLAVPPPLAAFRIETPDVNGAWAAIQFDAVTCRYEMVWDSRSPFRIYVGNQLWEEWRPQMQMSRQALGPGNHNVPL